MTDLARLRCGRPLVVDLCCGRGGWSKGFLAEGFYAVGYDIEQYDYPGELILRDVRDVTPEDLAGATIVVASTPCQQFSVHGMKMFHPNPPYPALGVELFNHVRAICEAAGVPYIMENVRPAESFVGRAVNHVGPFYLWGTGVPALIPTEAFAATKRQKGFNLSRDPYTGIRAVEGARSYGSKSKGRRDMVAQVAEIPPALSEWIARCFKPEIPSRIPIQSQAANCERLDTLAVFGGTP
jgi:hypothetical protein